MELIAHRGSAFDAPENSLEAFLRAIDEGAQRLELDIQVSRDGIPFVCHDETTGRVANRDVVVRETDAETLDTLTLSNGEPIPRFSALCEAVSGRAELDVELKVITEPSARKLLEAMQTHGLLTNALVTSFHPNALHIMRAAGYTGASGLIVGTSSWSPRQRLYDAWPFAHWHEVGATHLVIHHRATHPLQRRYLARHGGSLILWMSMQDEAENVRTRTKYYERIARIRPDGVIVGRVREAREVFRNLIGRS